MNNYIMPKNLFETMKYSTAMYSPDLFCFIFKHI